VSTVTNAYGQYTLSNVESGTRQITYSRSGYETKIETVNVTGGSTINQDVDLSPSIIPLTLTAGVASTATVTRGTSRRLFADTAQSSSIAPAVTRLLLLAVITGAVAIARRRIGARMQTTSTSTSEARRAVAQRLSSVGEWLTTLRHIGAWRVPLSVIAGHQPTLAPRSTLRRLLGNATSSISTLGRSRIIVQLLTVASATTAELRRGVSRLLAYQTNTTARTTRGVAYRLHTATDWASNLDWSGVLRVVLAAVSTNASTIARRHIRRLVLSVVSSAEATVRRQAHRLLSVAYGSTTTLRRGARLTLGVCTDAYAWMSTIRSSLLSLITDSTSALRRTVSKYLARSTSAQARLRRGYGKLLTRAQSWHVGLRRHIRRQWRVVSGSRVNLVTIPRCGFDSPPPRVLPSGDRAACC